VPANTPSPGHTVILLSHIFYHASTEALSDAHRERLDALLKRKDSGRLTWLAWLRQSPGKPNSRHMLDHVARLWQD
jgi:hypothetical protein